MNRLQKGIKFLGIILAMFIISSIISGILFAFSIIVQISSDGKQNEISFEQVYENVKDIDIDLPASKLNIKYGNKFHVIANASNGFTSKYIDGKLEIKEKSDFFVRQKASNVTLYVPESLNSLYIKSGAGTVDINNIQVNDFDVNHGAGLLEIDSSNFANVNINGGVGEIKIKNSILNNLYLKSGVGKATIYSYLSGTNFIESGIGDVNLQLQGGKESYKIDIKKGIGKVLVDKTTFKDDGTYGSGNRILKINSGIGKVNINFD